MYFRLLIVGFIFFVHCGISCASTSRIIVDVSGRNVEIQEKIEHVICSGPGCLRLLTYLQAQHLAVGVDDIEIRRREFDARPYALANPQFKELPVFGAFRGQDNPERILTLSPQPQVIFKTYGDMGHNPIELQKKTGIPVVILSDGDLGKRRQEFYQSLRTMAQVTGREERAEAIISFFEYHIAELDKRTADLRMEKKPSVFVGGVAFKGAKGFQSTETAYPPFSFVKANNIANDGILENRVSNTDMAKEKIICLNPDYLFLDLATLQLGEKAGGLHDLRTDPSYKSLTAFQNGRVYGLLPYNWYSKNYGSILANAYFVGKLLYPDHFHDIDPVLKADEIYAFLVGAPVFTTMNSAFKELVYKTVPLEQ